tara:strand:- start:7771 stop:9516 length:1746 start_codon:yes stop_codon:yes gene_type:complete
MKIDIDQLKSMKNQMIYRGPDGDGIWLNETKDLGLGHVRLSIIDLNTKSNQPLISECKRYVIIFNGEIYNYKELRAELIHEGYYFKTKSDTEVILNLYKKFGYSFYKKVRGMFSFIIWDNQNKELIAARDPFGIKPLYYYDFNGQLIFSSSVKSLSSDNTLNLEISEAGHIGFLIFGHVPEPFTLYKHIKSLPAGSIMSVKKQDKKIFKYFSIKNEIEDTLNTFNHKTFNKIDYLNGIINNTIEYHMTSDVDVSLFLSGGLDSATILSHMNSNNNDSSKNHSITLGFDEFSNTYNNEVIRAKKFAKKYNSPHIVANINKNFYLNIQEDFYDKMDQPTIDGLNTYLISNIAKKNNFKVAISGIGADEFFAGYPSFSQIPILLKYLKKIPFKNKLFDFFNNINHNINYKIKAKYLGLLKYSNTIEQAYFLRRALHMPWEIRNLFGESFFDKGYQELDLFNVMSKNIIPNVDLRINIIILELNYYLKNQLLRDADWAGMANSVEIRTPFVDFQFFKELLPIIISSFPPNKKDLSSNLKKNFDNIFLYKKKSGFSTPINLWEKSNKLFDNKERSKKILRNFNTIN